jgi:hypothetical protein
LPSGSTFNNDFPDETFLYGQRQLLLQMPAISLDTPE